MTADATGAWSFTPTGLADGAHTIVASQTDSFGNTGTASLSFTLDTTAPVVAITSAGGPTNQAAQTITGTVDIADAGTTVTLLDGTSALGTAVVQPNGSWSIPVTLSSGSNSLTAAVSDAAGNTGTSSAVVFNLSTTGPTLTEALAIDTGNSASDHITSNDALSGTGLASTAVHFTIDGSAIATTVTADATGAWSFTPSGLADGAHTIVASQTDSFGNTGTASLSFTLDTTAPVVAVTSSGGPTNQAAQTITGTVDVGRRRRHRHAPRRHQRGGHRGGAAQWQLEHPGHAEQRQQLADRSGQRRRRQHRHLKCGGLQFEHHRSDPDRGAGHRYRHRRPATTSPRTMR